MGDIDTGESESLICDQCGGSCAVRLVLALNGEIEDGKHVLAYRKPPCRACGSKELHWASEGCPQCRGKVDADRCVRCGVEVLKPKPRSWEKLSRELAFRPMQKADQEPERAEGGTAAVVRIVEDNPGIDFDLLKKELPRRYRSTKDEWRPKYLRVYVEDAVRGVLIVAQVGTDGKVRYRAP